MASTNVFNELCVKSTLLQSTSNKFYRGYVMRCTSGYDLMHIPPPVTAEGYDGSHHPRYVE